MDLFDRQLLHYTPLLTSHRLIGSTIIVVGFLNSTMPNSRWYLHDPST